MTTSTHMIRTIGLGPRSVIACFVAAGLLGGAGTSVVRAERVERGEPAERAQRAERAEQTGAIKAGQAAPGFALQDTQGNEHRLSDYLRQGKTVVLEWFNPDCPFVKRHHLQEKTMSRLFAQYQKSGLVWLAINSAAPGKQGHGLDRNTLARKEYGIDYPVLLDESGRVGRSYGAKTTPHIFIINPAGVVLYAGAIDDDPRGTKSERAHYVAQVLEKQMKGEEAQPSETSPYGCSVKYADGAPK